ncbi:MOSC domain-containing protein [Rothia aerolata]|uniref:Molybdenum cofactor biosysynthesis protein n=1 Tax=Rothia aerolata TaxID=1812262 RepID=A0A917MTU6_9MICC|nr:MOSC domain-containing protein [Rothia aerolata]GGH63467.1 molybdenum cofactor biosysynthesis protein [Rothia aerolata]
MTASSQPRVLSTNIAAPFPCPTGEDRLTGICKQPRAVLEVFIPGPNYGDGPGVRGDVVGDTKHHGGADKAVYAFAREELDYWGKLNGSPYTNGTFGENLTTKGISWSEVVINQRVEIGTALLEVSVPRQPCRTFAEWLGQKGWVKTFTAHGDCGAYLRVVEPGEIRPGDELIFRTPPAHGITMGEAFAAKMGDKELARKVYEAACLPKHHHDQLARLLR